MSVARARGAAKLGWLMRCARLRVPQGLGLQLGARPHRHQGPRAAAKSTAYLSAPHLH